MQNMQLVIKEKIDNIVVESGLEKRFAILDDLMNLIRPYMLQSYKEFREITQFFIEQLERIPSVCVPFYFLNIHDLIGRVLVKAGNPVYLDYINSDWDGDVNKLLCKVAPFLAGEYRTFDLHPEVGEVLTGEERRFIASSLTHTIQEYSVKTQWDEGMFQNAMFFCNILYPICRKDNALGLLFHAYDNIIDRLNTSNYSQHARDLAESLLIVGFNEGLKAEACLSACRAYTGANNVIAGLLFYCICISELLRTGKRIDERFAFDLYWQYLKICRTYSIYPTKEIERVTELFEKLTLAPYDKLSFHHTKFTVRLAAKKKTNTLVDEIKEYLDQNREVYFSNLERGSMPWITLILSLQGLRSGDNYAGLMPYVAAAKQLATREGNDMYFDLLEGKNLAKHLKEVQFKLQDTRNRSDYAMDNLIAMIIAKKLLCQAYEKGDVGSFLMAMSPKTDYSIVLPVKEVNSLYKSFEIADVDGDDLSSIYSNPKRVGELMALEEKDIIYWIGEGNYEFLVMTFFEGFYEKRGVISVPRGAVKEVVEEEIAILQYERETKEPGKTVYVKSVSELEAEGIALVNDLTPFSISVPESSKRLIFIKDIEIAAFPHQLFVVNNSSGFVGADKPSCNALSTEVFFKTNTSNSLRSGFTKKFWIPFGSRELTFDMIHSKLEDVIQKYQITVQKELSIDNPLEADMTLLCAHGGFDISSSEVFYVDNKPILDTLPCIGSGKVAVLFICYSGTISSSLYDNAMHTLVKKLILKGYSSVVAPMWSLYTDIITPWLNVFLGSMVQNEYIIDAVFKANMAIKNEFVAPSAWACLHLFGNPYTSISERDRIMLE